MRHRLLVLTALAASALLAACSSDPELIVPTRLTFGQGLVATTDRPQFDVVVEMENPATAFIPEQLMTLRINGVDHASEVQLAGYYGVLRIDPAPAGSFVIVELGRRTGEIIDTFGWDVQPYTGPMLVSATPETGAAGTSVDLVGANLGGTDVKVWFGGVAATVDAASPTAIRATVPDGALPGLVYVQIDGHAAEGIVGFQPLDGTGAPVEFPPVPWITGIFPSVALHGQATRIYGTGFNVEGIAIINYGYRSEVVGWTSVPLSGVTVGETAAAFAVVPPSAFFGDYFVSMGQYGFVSNTLPFRVR